MAFGRAVSVVVLCLAWASAAFGGAEPSRGDVVRALMQRSRLIDDVQFQLPVEIYRLYLAERMAASEKAPVAFIIEQGRYGVTLDEKNLPSLRVELSVRVLDPAGSRAIPVLSAALAWDKVTVNGQVSKLAEKSGRLQLMPDKAGMYSIVASAKLGRGWADKARIVLAASRSVRTIAKFDAPGKWRVSAKGAARAQDAPAEGGTHVELPLVPSRRIEIAWTRPVTLPPRPPRYEVRGAIAWNIDAGRQQVAARMNVRILGGATDRLSLAIGRRALRCEITGPDVRETRISAGVATVFLRGPVTGQTRLFVNYELPIGAAPEKALAAPALADGHWAGGTLVVTETAGASELLAGDIRGLREIRESDIPAEARAILAGKPVLAYEITSRDFDASVEVLDLGEFALRESIADLAHYQVLFRPDGSVMCKIDYEIRNRTRQFLRIHLPADSRVLSARVNDVPKALTPVAGEPDAFLLPLVRSRASVKGLVSFPVQIVVLCRAAALGRRGVAELSLPTIDLPIAYGWCDLYVPSGMKVREWSGPMRKVEQFSSETAVASLSYGAAELAEGYRTEDRIQVAKAPKPTSAKTPGEVPDLRKIPIFARVFENRVKVRPDKAPAIDREMGALVRPTTGQSLPIEHLTTTVEVPEGGTLLLGGQMGGGQSLLAKNYYRAGKDFYAKGDYANAAESFGNVRRMAPGSVEATNAGRLLANIKVVHGEHKAASREEKALGKQVQTEIVAQNLVLEQQQAQFLEQADLAVKTKNLAQAEASYKAAESLGLKLIAQGANKSDQRGRMRQARRQLAQIDEQQKRQVEKLRRQYQQLKASGNDEWAFDVGNALRRLSKEKDEKEALRGELEKLAISSVRKEEAYQSERSVWSSSRLRGETRRTGTADMPEATDTLAQQMARLIQNRVDPQGLANLEWRPVDAGRITVRMPTTRAATRGEGERNEATSARFSFGLSSGIFHDKKPAVVNKPYVSDGLKRDEYLRYPRNWTHLTEDRKGFQASAAGETGADAALREKLSREIERLSFASIDYKDVITFLREYSDANIHVNWRALTAAGIEQTTKVSVDVRKITVKRALDLVLRDVSGAAAAELRYVVDGGVLTISTKADLAKEPIRRVYDVRDLVIASDGEQTVNDVGRRGKELERNMRGSLGTYVDVDGDGLPDDFKVVDGKLIITANLGGQRQAAELLDKLREIRGPQVELGGNIAGQRASGLVDTESGAIGKVTRIAGDVPLTASAAGLASLYGIQMDLETKRAPGAPTEASKARFEDYIRRNYKWAISGDRLDKQDRSGGYGGGGGSGGAAIAGGGRITDRATVVMDLAAKLSSNLWQDVTVNSRNINLSAGDASQLGIEFQQGVNSVRFATVDEAQLRTLRQLEAQRGGEGQKVAANPRLQETIVGTEALLAGGQKAYIAHAGERSNTIDLAGNPIVLPHEKYVLIDAGGFITAFKAGEMQHWTQSVRDEDVGFADVPQELDVPRVGNLVKLEKTLIRPADRLTIRAEYTWKRAVK